ncbi:MAG: FAD-binding protein [Bauldia sp.]
MSEVAAAVRLVPRSEEEAAAIVADAAAHGRTLAIAGGGTRAAFGRPVEADATLSSARLTGITFYAPSEMVFGAKAGTPLVQVEAALRGSGQGLTFEPMDHRPLFGSHGEPTIGAVAAGNISGPARIHSGAARDHLIGVRFVNGSGEIVKSGGRVMKNVTGLDLVKLLSGSFGTLGFLTEVIFKVLPLPAHSATLVIHGLDDRRAINALAAALGSPFQPTGAAHLPAGIDWSGARTLVRVEGFPDSVAYRLDSLAKHVSGGHRTERLDGADAAALWRNVRDATFLADPHSDLIWRLSVTPTAAWEVTAAIAAKIKDARWFYDWGGGLVWLAVPPLPDAGAATIRGVVGKTGGHATLVRAPAEIRMRVPVFEPLSEALMKLSAGIKASFDPKGVFEPGRMYS